MYDKYNPTVGDRSPRAIPCDPRVINAAGMALSASAQCDNPTAPTLVSELAQRQDTVNMRIFALAERTEHVVTRLFGPVPEKDGKVAEQAQGIAFLTLQTEWMHANLTRLEAALERLERL